FESEPSADPEPVVEEQQEAAEPEPQIEEEQVDLALSEPDEWEDLLGDLVEPETVGVEEDAEQIDEPGADELPAIEETRSEPLDVDTQFAIQAEAMGIDLSGLHATPNRKPIDAAPEIDDAVEEQAEDEPQIESGDTSIEEDLIAAAFESEAAQKALAELQEAAALEDTPEPEAEEDVVLESEPEPEAEEEIELESEPGPEPEAEELDNVAAEPEEEELEIPADIEFDVAAELEAEDEVEREDDVEDIALVFDDKVEEAIATIAASLDDESFESKQPDVEEPSDEHNVPEMSEEEKTINMMIDQELFNIAVEDEEGFASTIVQLQPSKKIESEIAAPRKAEQPPLFETIIMEGESVRSEEDVTVDSRRFDDPGVSIPLKQTMSKAIRGGRRFYDPPSAGVIVGVVALLLLLILQVIHQSREALATVPAFNKAVGPVYRMLGSPVTPSWNISGWRFEATKGSTDEADQLLTIYSRVGNNSDQALPYPLVHLSLTDRYEEIIGSRVLDPGEYLADNADPRKLVPPGNTFNAVISIESPSEAATGFKLNVCYRLTGGQLRCAIEDFK
ncbi:MAG: DUF3426 domain-containing protein, partial [Gammaproteobacteria bacterium]|nr:DUF3426 domain-containing protein [Gammaproteobacteria bacterium]